MGTPSMTRIATCLLYVAVFVARTDAQANSATRDVLTEALHFHATFDGDANATMSAGKGLIMTADSMERMMLVPGIQRSDVTATGTQHFGDRLANTCGKSLLS